MAVLGNLKKTIKEFIPEVVSNVQISGQSNAMIYKHEPIAIIKGSKLVVAPSQEAIFVQNGIIEAVFGPGNYMMDIESTPIAQKLLSMTFSAGIGNRAEIWFINKSVMMDVSWGTANPIPMEEMKFGVPLTIRVRCNGALSLKVTDSVALFTKLAGQGQEFTIENFKTAMRGMMLSRLQKTLGELMSSANTGFVNLQHNITVIEQPLQERMQEELKEYGLEAVGCYVKGFSVLEDDAWERYKKYEDEYFQIQAEATRIERIAAAKANSYETLGTSYNQERQFDSLDIASSSAANQTNFQFGASAQNNPINTMAAAMFSQPVKEQPKVEEFLCYSCNAKIDENTKFCCECGAPMVKVCSGCGVQLPGKTKFCPECGTGL